MHDRNRIPEEVTIEPSKKLAGSEPRIGVFICHCGTNIAGFVDVKSVVEYASKQPGVILVADYRYVCSEPGQALIRDSIREHGLNRVVVAACSPRMHEPTFRKVAESTGLNPFLVEMANIREQCSWVHMHQPEEATRKAKALVGSAMAKACLLEPLAPTEFKVEPNALVIGGGIAGIQSSLDLAEKGFKVYLDERESSIGGRMAQLDKTFPTLDCSACILTPKMVDVGRNPNIVLMAYSEVKNVEGFIGNFKVTVTRKARYVDDAACTGCGVCAEKCPIKVPNDFDVGLGVRKAIYVPFPQAVPITHTIDKKHCLYFTKGVCKICEKMCPAKAVKFDQKDEDIDINVGVIVVATGYDLYDARQKPQYGYGVYRNVTTGLEFERLLNAAGPTGGKILRPSDKKPPKNVAFIQCVGSRDAEAHQYCSRVCCMASLKHAHQVKEKYPDADVSIFYIDLRAFGKGYEEFLERVQREGVRIVRGKVAEIYEQPDTKNLCLRFEDTLLGEVAEAEFDMVVLATAIEPRADTPTLQKMLKLSLGADGFFLEAHPKLRPVESTVAGIYLCGVAQSPKDIPDAVAQASGAASRATIPLIMGKVTIEPMTASVDEDLCSGCGICEEVCPYNAIEIKEIKGGKRKAEIHEALCNCCGLCGAACPSGAITMRHFTDKQISRQIETLLAPEER